MGVDRSITVRCNESGEELGVVTQLNSLLNAPEDYVCVCSAKSKWRRNPS